MKTVKEEFKKMTSNKTLLISVIVIILIPMLAASVLGKSMWNPTDLSKNLPVAVVNEDKNVEMMGTKVNVGEQLVANLKDNKDLKWEFVGKEEAEKGMKDLRYYMTVTFPENLSKDVTTLFDPNPTPLEIIYSTNGSLSYLGSVVGTVAASTIESQLRENITEQYLDAVVKAGGEAVKEIPTVLDGVDQLAGGTQELDTGLATYTAGVKEAFGGANELDTALTTINNMAQPLGSKTGEIQNGLTDIVNGTRDLEASLKNVEDSLDPNSAALLNNDIEEINKTIETIFTNSSKMMGVSNDAHVVATDLYNLSNQFNQLGSGLNELNTRVIDEANKFSAGMTDIINAQTGIDDTIKSELVAAIGAHLDVFALNVSTAVQDANQVIENDLVAAQIGLVEVSDKANALSLQANAVSELAGGIASSSGLMQDSVNNVRAGTDSLLNAVGMKPHSMTATQLIENVEGNLEKADNLAGDIPTVLGGVNELASGGQQLSAGLGELNENSPTVMSGIGQLNDATQEIKTMATKYAPVVENLKITNKQVEMFAAPANTKSKPFSTVKIPVQGFAPLLLSSALFIGALIFCLVYPVASKSVAGISTKDWLLDKVVVGFVVSTIMALVAAVVLQMMGLPIDQLGKFYMTTLVTSWSFMFLNLFLAVAFGNVGRLLSLFLVGLQLASSGGILPLQMTTGIFKAINPIMPMTYSIQAYKEALSRGMGEGVYTQSLWVLIIIAVVAIILTGVAMNIREKKESQGNMVPNTNA